MKCPFCGKDNTKVIDSRPTDDSSIRRRRQCDECGKKHEIFGRSHLSEIAAQCEIPRTARMPLNPALAAACDAGKIEMFDGDWLDELAGEIAAL